MPTRSTRVLLVPVMLRAAFVIGLLAAASALASAAEVDGKLTSAGVVWISDGSKLPSGQFQMAQTNKTFVPDLLVVPVGANVRFPNNDNFYHSVYSVSTANPFDIGFYDTGPGKLVTFSAPGVDLITCHIHAVMHAAVIVVDGPSARTTADGQAFSLKNVAPGTHMIHSWSLTGGQHDEQVRVPDARARVALDHAL
jgi:plastocyanin